MPDTDTRTTTQLFKEWRGGDAAAGQAMAQRFADWYYAIATSRLGESRGRAPCEASCARFGQGVVQVTETRKLVGWAHDIMRDELSRAGERATDGDEPNAFTGHKAPKGLLVRARGALPDEVALLEAVYGGKASQDTIEALAEPFGGNPLGVLEARYRVKRWLRDHAGVPFEVAPDTPVLDRAPLPLYESARMASPDEEVGFEHWMVTDLDLCKDIAEFAHFAIALRGGLPATASVPAAERPTARLPAPEAKATANVGAAAAGGVAVLAVGGVVVLLLLAALVGMFLL